ncbi:MAG: hypothetical protein AAF039_14005 [Bacteroidota bacterium]
MKNNDFDSLAVYKSSLALRDLSDALGHYFSPEHRVFSKKNLGLRAVIAESLRNDASLIPATIEKTYKSSSINHRLKNANFINIITRNILSYCNGLENDGIKEKEYLQLLRGELKTFRKSFKQWRKSLLYDSE